MRIRTRARRDADSDSDSRTGEHSMDIDIAGKVIVVTGAARGIGRTLALGLAAEGARVAVLARERQQAQLVVDEIGGAPLALALEADVSDETAVTGAAAE